MPVGGDQPPPVPRSPPQEELGYPLGARIGGAIVVVAAGVLAAGVAHDPSRPQRWLLLAALLVLAVLGVALLIGLGWARWVVAASAIAAAALVSEHAVRDRLSWLVRDPLSAAARAFVRGVLRELPPTSLLVVAGFAAGCLLLVVGRPRRVRLVVGALLAASPIASELVRALAR
jgi:hypothetical protein